MSLFRRPKKAAVHRRVFSVADDDENGENSGNEIGSGKNSNDDEIRVKTPPPPCITDSRKNEKKHRDDKKSSNKKTSLLSFGDEGMLIFDFIKHILYLINYLFYLLLCQNFDANDSSILLLMLIHITTKVNDFIPSAFTDDEAEVFQVKKSSHSKKVMKMLDKERRRKKCRDKDQMGHQDDGKFNSKTNSYSDIIRTYEDTSPDMGNGNDDLGNNSRSKPSNNFNHTEIRTDDFVVRLLFINLFVQTQRQPHTTSSTTEYEYDLFILVVFF